jgi:hypothetical protein
MKSKLLISFLVAIMLVVLQVGAAAAAPAAQDPTPVEEPTGCGAAETPTEETGTPTDTTTTDTTTEEETPTEGEEANHPVAQALADFFCGALGVDYDTIIGFHEGTEEMDGYGFGVIAQALWAAKELDADPAAILAAKTSGDYTGLVPEGMVITNWGQFRKFAFAEATDDYKHNLGEIMSGKADPLGGEEVQTEGAGSDTVHGKGYLHSHKDKHHPH